MAEFEGVGGNPIDLKNSATTAASADVMTLAEYMKQDLEVTKLMQTDIATIKDAVKNSFTSTDISHDNVALQDNTIALRELTDTIGGASIRVDGSNFDRSFFKDLLSLTSSKRKQNRLLAFANTFELAAKTMGNAGRYAKGIEKVATAMASAVQPISQLGKAALMFSGGLALLGLTMVTFIEAITLEDLAMFGAIMLTIAAASKIVKGASWDVAKTAAGIALLGLTIWGWNEVVTVEMATTFSLTIAGVLSTLALTSRIVDGLSKGKGFSNIYKAAGAIAVMSGSLFLFGKVMDSFKDVDIERVGSLALSLGIFGAEFAIMGNFSTQILQGALAAGAIGASLWVASKGLQELSKVDMSLEQGLALAAILAGAAGVLALIGNPITIGFTLAGAAASAAIGGSFIILAAGLKSLATVSITEEQADKFKYAVGRVTDTFIDFANPLKLPLLILGLAQSVAVAGATLAMSGAIAIVSKIPIAEPEKFENFKYGAIALGDLFADYGGIIRTPKILAGTVTGLAVAAATVAIATGIRLFTFITSSPDAVKNATTSLDLFIGGVEQAFVSRQDSFPAITKGISSFMGIADLVKEVADSVQAIGNLEFVEKEVRDGKVVVKSVRKFNEDDFKRIGTSVGMILSSLTDPLIAIGGAQDTFSIGGFTITNPFSNKVQKGIEAVQGLSSVFTPLATIVDVFAKNNINSSFVGEFNANLGTLLQGITKEFIGMEGISEESLKRLGVGSVFITKFIDKIVHDKFAPGVANFEKLALNVASVKDSINAMELDKLAKLNELVFNIKASVESDAISELVEVFRDFIDRHQSEESSTAVSTERAEITEATKTAPKSSNDKTSSKQNSGENLQQLLANADNETAQAIDELLSFLKTGTLRVKGVNF